MSRLFRTVLLLAGLAAIAGAGTAPSTAAGLVKLSPYHEPPWLIQRGKPVTLAYALLDGSVKGTLYVRNSLQANYTRLTLTRGAYCPGDPVDAAAMRRDKVCGDALVAHVPRRLAAGSKLFYYAALRDPASGRSATVPAGGAEKPQRVWIVDRFLAASLGTHQFGRVRAPDAIVARAGPNDVGLTCCADPPGGDGPSSFDIAPDGSIWVLDRLNHRLLVWRAGHPAHPARSVTLPRNLNVSDFSVGRNGTIFIRAGDTADLGNGNKDHLYALTATGRLHWQAPTTAGIATAQLQLGPNGALYAVQACGLTCAPFGGHVLWTPLTTRAGRPLSLAERAEGTSPFEPLPSGLRLVTELFASPSPTGRLWARSTCSLRYGSGPTEGSTSSAQTSKREQASPGTRSGPRSGGFEEDRQMEALSEMRCVACRRDAPTVTEAEIAELHPQVSEWEIVQQEGIKKLSRVFPFDDFAKALAFTNALGKLAEEEGHHPTLVTEWGRTTVTWWTHKIKGLHRNDFVMAAKADELYRRLSV